MMISEEIPFPAVPKNLLERLEEIYSPMFWPDVLGREDEVAIPYRVAFLQGQLSVIEFLRDEFTFQNDEED